MDLLTDDAGRGSFPDAQYVLVSTVVLAYAAASLARFPDRLPQLPWALALLVALSAAVYLAAKYAEGSRPLVLSVVRRREPGDLDAAVRPGDDIEIRGVGFVPPGAQTPEMLARLVVRIGAVHVHVPLVPVAGGFTNPSDAVLTVPVAGGSGTRARRGPGGHGRMEWNPTAAPSTWPSDRGTHVA